MVARLCIAALGWVKCPVGKRAHFAHLLAGGAAGRRPGGNDWAVPFWMVPGYLPDQGGMQPWPKAKTETETEGKRGKEGMRQET